MDTPTLRVSEPREMLALVPHQLGFHPRQSVVAIGLRPPRGRVGLVVRVDLADLADPVHGPRLARNVVAHLDGDGADRALLVVYTDADPREGPDPVVAAAVAHAREAAATPFGEVAAWVVTSTGYLCLDCRGACCPPGGRPLDELASTQVGAAMVLAGSTVADCRDDVARIRLASAEPRRSVARVRRRWLARGAAAHDEGPEAEQRWRAGGVAAWRRAIDEQLDRPGGPCAAALGRLEAGLTDPRVRDAVLVALVPGTGDLPERSVRGVRPSADDDAALGRALALVVDPLVGVPAPPAATRVHEAVLEAVVAHGERGRQAPAHTLLGMLAWWRGDGARAQLLLAAALEDDPGYRLALLIADAVGCGVPPGWVRARR
jgi:hypothetical protein